MSWHRDSLPVTGSIESLTLARFSHCHSHILEALKLSLVQNTCIFLLKSHYCITGTEDFHRSLSWGISNCFSSTCVYVCVRACVFLFVCFFFLSSRTDGSRWSAAGHAAAGGLGRFSLRPSSGSNGPWAARCYAGQDGAQRCTHETQQPARAPTDAPVPDDGQW